jgi:hypothetical protein
MVYRAPKQIKTQSFLIQDEPEAGYPHAGN